MARSSTAFEPVFHEVVRGSDETRTDTIGVITITLQSFEKERSLTLLHPNKMTMIVVTKASGYLSLY
jgi:hypothetical protein